MQIQLWLRDKQASGTYQVLLGGPGLGKTALSCVVAKRASSTDGGDTVPTLLYISKAGQSPRDILKFLLWQASAFLDDSQPASFYQGGLLDLRDRLIGTLAQIVNTKGGVLVVIDGLDEIVGVADEPARVLQFLPDTLPDGVRILLTSRPIDSAIGHLSRRLQALTSVELMPLVAADAASA